MSSARLPQLDGIRTIAVFLVLLQHLGGVLDLSPGHRGVSLFFVLSGFLITGILLRDREKIDHGISTTSREVRRFYIRRAGRIFPLYYGVVILGALIANFQSGRQYWWSLLPYLTNLQISWTNVEPPVWSVFWSLAVEEHFYLFWPALILLVRPKTSTMVAVALVIVAIIWRYTFFTYFRSYPVALNKVDLACVDSIALGALLAMVHQWTHRGRALFVLSKVLMPLAIIFSIGLYLLTRRDSWLFDETLSDVSIGIVFCWLISRASMEFKWLPGRLLGWWPIAWIGRVSYGIYVYHLIFYRWLFPDGNTKGFYPFVLVTALTIVASGLSFHLFEDKFGPWLKKKLEERFDRQKQIPQEIFPVLG